MTGWRGAIVRGLVGGAVVGAADALHAVTSGRLGLGPVGVGALLLAGLLVGAALGAGGLAVLAAPPPLRRLRGVLHGLLGGVVVLAARLAAGAATSAGPALLGPAGDSALAGAATVAVGVLLAWLSRRWRQGPWVLVALGVGGLLAWALAGRVALPVGRPSSLERPNVLLVTIAGARADRYGPHPIDTTGFDRVAAEGVRLDVAIAPGGDAAAAADDLLHARPPVRLVDAGSTSLAAALAAEGYATAAFLGAPLDLPSLADVHVRDDTMAWPLGADRTLPGLLLRAVGAWTPPVERRAGDVVDRAIRFTTGRAGAWLVWVHLHDPAPPFEPPVPFDERYAPDGPGGVIGSLPERVDPAHGGRLAGVRDPAVVEARYDGEIAYADAQLVRLLAALDERGRSATTLVVVVGLYGTSLVEGDRWFGRGEVLTEGVLRVPAALRLPGRVPVGERVRTPVELADVGATILDYLGLPDAVDGAASLRPTVEGLGVARRAARARTDDAAALRLPGVLLAWSRGHGFSARRIDGEPTDALAWTAERVREEVGRLPGDVPAPRDDEVEALLRAIRRAGPGEPTFER